MDQDKEEKPPENQLNNIQEEDQFLDAYTEPFLVQLTRQMKTLLQNAFQLQNIHNESKVFSYSENDSQSSNSSANQMESSIGTISSGDEDDCAILFSGEHKYRFLAEEGIMKKNRIAENERRAHQLKMQQINKPNRCRQLVAFICCRGLSRRVEVGDGGRETGIFMAMSPRRAGVKNQQQGSKLLNEKSSLPGSSRSQMVIEKDQKLGQQNRDKGQAVIASGQKKGISKDDDALKNQSKNNVVSKERQDNSNDKIWQQRIDLDSNNNGEDGEYQEYDENYEFDDDEIVNWSSDNDSQERPNCWSKCLRKIKTEYMIDPDNKKLRAFHMVVALSFYIDVIVTSLMIGNYDYQIGNNPDYLNHLDIYYIIILIQAIDIILNFVKIQVIDITKIDEPGEVAIQYLKGPFATDLIAIFPYNMFYPNYIFLRLIRARRYKHYQEYVAKWICETTVDIIDQETVKKLVETFNLTLMLILLSHFFACLWILMGLTRLRQYNDGWIRKTKDDGRQDVDFVSLYITSQYWVLTSYTSVGYGDITGTSQIEYLYQMLLEMLGIGIFGYMTGLIQTLFIGLGAKDLGEENQELVNLWLIKLDKAVPEKLLSKLVFEDVRQFYEQQFRHDASEVMQNNEFFALLKPRLQKAVLDAIFQSKYELFADILDQSCIDFQRELVLNFEFRFHSANQPGQQNPNIFNPEKVELPILDHAFEEARYIHFLVRGEVHMMDHTGMYDYGVVQKGSYFGDVSVILRKPNEFAYFYDPYLAIKKPLSLFRVDANIFRGLLDKYPLEKDIWTERAKKREEFFSSYKTLALVKMMKSIVKNPSLIRHNLKQFQKNKLSLVRRVQYFKEREIKLNLLRLFLRQYELLRILRRKYNHDNALKKQMGGKAQPVQSMMDKTLNVKRPKLFDQSLKDISEKYNQTMCSGQLPNNQSVHGFNKTSHNSQSKQNNYLIDMIEHTNNQDDKDKVEQLNINRNKPDHKQESPRQEITQFHKQIQEPMPVFKRDLVIIDPETFLNQRSSHVTNNSELKSAEFGCVSNSNLESNVKIEHNQKENHQNQNDNNEYDKVSQKSDQKSKSDNKSQLDDQKEQKIPLHESPPNIIEGKSEIYHISVNARQHQQPQFEDESQTFIQKEEKVEYTNMSPGPMRYEGGAGQCNHHQENQNSNQIGRNQNLSESSSQSSSSQSSKSSQHKSQSGSQNSSDFERDNTTTQGHKTITRTRQFPIDVDNEGFYTGKQMNLGDQAGSDFENLRVIPHGSAPQKLVGLAGDRDSNLKIRQIKSTIEPAMQGNKFTLQKEGNHFDYEASFEFGGQNHDNYKNELINEGQSETLNYNQEANKLSFDEVCKLFGYDYCKKTIFKELEETTPEEQYARFEQMKTAEVENTLFENTNFIQCVLNQYFLCKLAREKAIQRKKNSLHAVSRIIMLRHNKSLRVNLRSRDMNHMDNIIDEYLSLDIIQKQILFNKHNLEFYFKKNKMVQSGEWVSVNQNKYQDSHSINNQDGNGNMQTIFDNLKKVDTQIKVKKFNQQINQNTQGSNKNIGTCVQGNQQQCKQNKFHKESTQQHFEVNQKNIKLINYKENRLSEEIKVAIQIEQDCIDQTQALKTQGIHHLGSVIMSEATNLHQQLLETNAKFIDYSSKRTSQQNNSNYINYMGRSIESDRLDRRSSSQSPSCSKKPHDFPTKAVPSFFGTISPEQQDQFLNAIEKKVNEYEADKYRRFLEQSEKNAIP